MREFHNEVLTILCLTRAGEKTKRAFLDHLDGITLVPLNSETVFGDKAHDYLTQLAKNEQIVPDDKLYESISDPKKNFRAADLGRIFNAWFDRKLKTEVYAQYAHFEVINRPAAAVTAKGSAISELTEMIGLTEAKAVINQALDFYKAQKLLMSRGVGDLPPCHAHGVYRQPGHGQDDGCEIVRRGHERQRPAV
jgi:hypothetical protein